jgi:hypothetical protein
MKRLIRMHVNQGMELAGILDQHRHNATPMLLVQVDALIEGLQSGQDTIEIELLDEKQ